ncbi:type II secretion system F family protein [Poseidonibacter lekithochrous]|uniref:type II secretion system F family protein n=1 Tax=Poseidonibacter lekithochrous TaxID=1904463 RepID=UPI0008FC5C66|nr:type II secretion system F family protein [Poseidonibacter lekithochrous]QKJ24327.1 Flp pilus assembly protein TadB [Poseidonibacter lekithochrous]
MDSLVLFFIVVIPILLVVLSFYLYSFYIKMNQQKIIINTLINTNSKILDKNRTDNNFDAETSWLRKKLRFAGFTANGAEYIFIFICIGFGILASSFIFLVAKSKIIFVCTLFIFMFFPYLFLVKIIKVREEEFNFSLKEIIDKVTSMMKSGVGFEQALKKSIITSKSKLAQKIFNIYINEKSVIGEDKCFEKMFKLVESRELRIFYLTISIGRKSGGKFSNTLEKLRKTLHDQGEIKQEITSSTKEIKVGTYMIIALIVFTYLMMNNALNNSLNAHFFGSDTGKLQMFFIIVWVAFGLFINSLLTKIK